MNGTAFTLSDVATEQRASGVETLTGVKAVGVITEQRARRGDAGGREGRFIHEKVGGLYSIHLSLKRIQISSATRERQ